MVTAQQVRSYKPDPAHFTECERRIGGKKGWVHVAASYYHDVEPCLKKKVPVIWVNRTKQQLESGQKKPDAEVTTLREAAKLLGINELARMARCGIRRASEAVSVDRNSGAPRGHKLDAAT